MLKKKIKHHYNFQRVKSISKMPMFTFFSNLINSVPQTELLEGLCPTLIFLLRFGFITNIICINHKLFFWDMYTSGFDNLV